MRAFRFDETAQHEMRAFYSLLGVSPETTEAAISLRRKEAGALLEEPIAPKRPSPLKGRPSPLKGRSSPLQGRPSPLKGRPSPLKGRPSPLKGVPSPLKGRPSPLK